MINYFSFPIAILRLRMRVFAEPVSNLLMTHRTEFRSLEKKPGSQNAVGTNLRHSKRDSSKLLIGVLPFFWVNQATFFLFIIIEKKVLC